MIITRIYFSLCGVRSMPSEMEKRSSYINNYYCFWHYALKKKEQKKKEKRVVECCTDSTRNVVFSFVV